MIDERLQDSLMSAIVLKKINHSKIAFKKKF